MIFNFNKFIVSIRASIAMLLPIVPLAIGNIFNNCDNQIKVTTSFSYLESPYYPNLYPAGTACRYRFIAPQDHYFRINCTLYLPKVLIALKYASLFFSLIIFKTVFYF